MSLTPGSAALSVAISSGLQSEWICTADTPTCCAMSPISCGSWRCVTRTGLTYGGQARAMSLARSREMKSSEACRWPTRSPMASAPQWAASNASSTRLTPQTLTRTGCLLRSTRPRIGSCLRRGEVAAFDFSRPRPPAQRRAARPGRRSSGPRRGRRIQCRGSRS